ncbi:MAG TPA: TROVE domain-containing protein [Pyrinomonadaceae bacterium]|nr:TROVE domain-containing protein [Pyrinomonadaceae bacterium]
MANNNIFKSIAGMFTPKADTINEAGGKAYKLSPKQALAQYAATGCFNNTFYSTAGEQLDNVLALANEVDAEFVAKAAIFIREKGHMKDMPAFLVAVLSIKDKTLFERAFPRVIDNGKMLRNFVQIMRSGAVGRKSLGSLPKRLVREWFEKRASELIFKQSVGQAPSIADIVKMVHPKPSDAEREALFGYFIGREIDADKLPEIVKRFERFKNGDSPELPDVPFQMLTALTLGAKEWVSIARNAPWQMTRMNLNTFERHGVFADKALVKIIADRLRDRDSIRKARVFPYQLLSAFKAAEANKEIPREITEALQDAMEIATENVPEINGKVWIFPDVSGSMHSAVTGYRKGSTSTIRCLDVAALIAAAILRKNPSAEIIPFSDDIVKARLNPRDSVMTNAQNLASLPSGGTNCSAPLRELNRRNANGDIVIYISDNESWMDSANRWNSGTKTMEAWNKFKLRNRDAKLICIDLQPNAHTQARERADILNIGGFSDQVFTLISDFSNGSIDPDHWVGVIDRVEL